MLKSFCGYDQVSISTVAFYGDIFIIIPIRFIDEYVAVAAA